LELYVEYLSQQRLRSTETSTMKKNLVSIGLLLLLFISSYGQKISGDKEIYRQKSQDQKTAGWVLTGLGSAMIIGGSIAFSQNFEVFGPGGESEAVIIGLGTAITAVGIIMLVKSKINKTRAEAFIYPKLYPYPNATVFNKPMGIEGRLCINLEKQKAKNWMRY
jgi:hypothetical protein